ncbi:hypothetical protein [uncultured Nitratireductor sp.]|uniref:hypothetical protein n=1 Tax=uncultured Nitratireductor sp. TaxID=520953 RepID=UPI0025E4C15F|nr:hypothetical protein [uncultured Nitratireductor sp.]
MKRFLACVFALLLTGVAAAQPIENFDSLSTAELIEVAPRTHPAALYTLSARLLAQGRGLEAAKWMYAGQLRYRFLVAALGDDARDERVLFSALTESVGRPVNEYVAGDPEEWILAMKWALDWDADHDNLLTSKAAFASELATVRSGLRELIDQVDENRDTIRRRRRESGLPVR